MKFFTLHIRLTRDCNAHCDYCSSAGVSEGRMSCHDFETAIDFITDEVFPRLGVGHEHFVTVEYLGGEVLVVPEEHLKSCVSYTRKRLSSRVKQVRDGVQSNLIATPRRVISLHDLFDGNLGTSWDQYTERRHVAGSPELYRGLLHRSLAALKDNRGSTPGRVLVIDDATAPHLEQEVLSAQEEGYDLVLRPVFQGGTDGVRPAATEELTALMGRCYDLWSRSPQIRIEPFHSLFLRRTSRGKFDPSGALSSHAFAGCPFQSDCAFKSLSLDPDGTLHVCQEMADAGHYPLGNAIEKTFDEPTWRLLARRRAKLSDDCTACQWRSECGGGCMNEAIESHGDPFAKTELCAVWKAIFARIEADVSSGRADQILKEIRR